MEYGEHTSEVTQVCFSANNPGRAFSCSADKLFKVYDLGARCSIKNIQLPSPINRMAIDSIEAYAFIACENQNVYCYSLEISSSEAKSKHKRTLQHKYFFHV